MEHFDRIVTDPAVRVAGLEAFLSDADPSATYRGEYHVFATSGSTGDPGLFVLLARRVRALVAVGLAAFARVGVTPETRLIAIGAPGDDAHHASALRSLPGRAHGTCRGSSVTTPIVETVEALNRTSRRRSLAYASVRRPARRRAALGSARDRAASSIVATSEVLTEDIERRVETPGASAPLNAYAATEAPLHRHRLARRHRDARRRGLRRRRGRGRGGRPVPPGVPGAKVLLTSLVNRTQPLIRYELTDSVVLDDGRTRAAGPYLRITRVDGRSDDILRFAGRRRRRGRRAPYRLRRPFSALLDVAAVPDRPRAGRPSRPHRPARACARRPHRPRRARARRGARSGRRRSGRDPRRAGDGHRA